MPFISANLDVAIRRYHNFSKRSQGTNCATFCECDTHATYIDMFIDLDESNSIGEEMCENHKSTFTTDSSVALAHGCTLIK